MTFVRNAWYVAALPEEISEMPLPRTILDTPLALYRQPDGSAAALLDICPHRFAALSAGHLKDGHLQCPYHGLEFDGAGRCVHNPHGNGSRPASLNVRAFPIVERDALIWVWPGDPALASVADIPDFSCRVDPGLRTVGGYSHVDSNYKLLVDNLMDLGHAHYVHRGQAQIEGAGSLKRAVVVDGGEIHALMMIPNGTPGGLMAEFLPGSTEKVDNWADIRWNKVSAMLNFVAVAPAGAGKEQSVYSRGTHIITPETESSSHYFVGSSRNFRIDDPEMDEAFRSWQAKAIMLEDKVVVEAIERRADYVCEHGLRQAMLACDEAAVRVSREIERLEQLESLKTA
ncbi:MAG TPA: aromatic ring-hydroxylating dioxygenase subunit alpha [Novosphingobium sp.]|nr:aromatic ring-hydroxylating dioxygenase subunit alpha [Novosphingobium sp.]